MSATETDEHEGTYRQLALVWIGLLVLLASTLVLSFGSWGGYAVIVAMSIATAKTMLIMRYYMHLKYRSALVWLFSITALVWLLLLFGLALTDYLTRHWVLVTP